MIYGLNYSLIVVISARGRTTKASSRHAVTLYRSERIHNLHPFIIITLHITRRLIKIYRDVCELRTTLRNVFMSM